MRILALSLLLAFASLPSSLGAQFTTEAAHTKDGVRWLVLPSATIATTEGVVRIEMTQIRARVDRGHGIIVDGQRYDESSFGGQIEADIAGLSVVSLSIGFTFDGVQGCSGRLGLAAWKEGEAMTLLCNSGGTARFTGYTVNGLSSSGVLELQSKIRRLRSAAARAAQQQAAAASAPAAGSAGVAGAAGATGAGASPAPAATRPTAGATASSTASAPSGSSPAASSPAASSQAAERAEAARVAEQQRVAADAARAAAADQMTTQIADLATGIAGSIAEDRRRAAANRQRLEEQRAEYRRLVAANFRRMPAQPLCTNARGIPVEVGADYSGQLTGTECRVEGGASAVVYTLEVKERSKVAFALRSYFWRRVAVIRQATGESLTGSVEYADLWLTPGLYNIVAHSELAGETGPFTLSVQRGRRSWAGGWQLGFGMDAATATADTYTGGGDLGGALIAMRVGMPIRQGRLIEESAAITFDLSFSEAVTTADLGLRVYVLGKQTAFRPYVQASYGYVSVCSQGCIDSDIFGTDYYYSSGTAMTLAAGLNWYYTPQYAIDLGYFMTNGTLDEGPMNLNRFRIGMSLHPAQPLAPR